MNASEDSLLTVKQAAARLAISERTLWQLANDGAVPVVRFGRTVRYDPADLREFIAARRRGVGATQES